MNTVLDPRVDWCPEAIPIWMAFKGLGDVLGEEPRWG